MQQTSMAALNKAASERLRFHEYLLGLALTKANLHVYKAKYPEKMPGLSRA